MKHLIRLLFAFLCLTGPASAQSVTQSGTVTPGHATRWISNGIIGDAGTAANGFITSLGVVNNGGPGICINSGPTTGAYNQLCFSAALSAAAKISLQNIGGAVAQPLQFSINGVTINLPSVPGSTFATITGPFVNGDLVCVTGTGALYDCGGAFPTFNNLFYANGYANVEDAIAAIGSTVATLIFTSPKNCSTAVTVLSTTKLVFEDGGRITKTLACTLAINGPVQAGPYQIFASFLTAVPDITFGSYGVTAIPPEWFTTAANVAPSCTGACAQTAVMSAFKSITLAGQFVSLLGHSYTVDACVFPITISGSGVIGAAPQQSVLKCGSATDPTITISGSVNGVFLKNFGVDRSVTPSGSSAIGISVSNVNNLQIEHVVSQNSTIQFLFDGGVNNTNCVNCQAGISTALMQTDGLTLYGFKVNGATLNASLRLYNSEAFALGNPTSSSTTVFYGLVASGANLQDLTLESFATTRAHIGVDLNCTGATCTNIKLATNTHDSYFVSCWRVTAAPAGSSVSMLGGWCAPSDSNLPTGGARIGLSCVSSANVSSIGVRYEKYITGVAANLFTGAKLDSCSNATITGNSIINASVGIYVGGPNGSNTITGNSIYNAAGAALLGVNMIHVLASSPRNTIVGNMLSGTTTNGINVASGTNNVVVGNSVNLLSGTDYVDAGTTSRFGVTGPLATTANNVPQWDSLTFQLKDGLGVGTSANQLVQLNGSAQLPAVNGGLLTGVSAANVVINTTTISGGTTLRVLFNNGNTIGEYTNTQLTALISVATASLSGALPAWPNNTTTFFRGDGTYTTLNCAALTNGATGCSTATGTSGATLPLLNGTNTWSGIQTFGNTTDTTTSATGGIVLSGGLGVAKGATIGTFLSVGLATTPTLSAGELGIAKITASGTAPGAGACKISAVAGTNAGTCKLIAICGTSSTAVLILDNIGAAC